ncbi:caspase-14-like isoform X5 [Babesia caballi]|uniref:Caspase-14-like isoform X5 n=1 Tax=Babesia caballi TaxID=5871 RepID=A0AAV4LLE9_BABCB|nr:caspase-14-like isoform X5 [Babesia caballi]
MEVIPVKLAEALDTLKRKQLERRPVRVHEGVIARLETCERKRDSSRGSGLQYLLHNLNHHCHYLSPDKLLEALRILSDNQLFDRRTLYNLYDTIAKNLPYFTSTQHRSLLDSISKCINYTVKGTKLLSEEECTSIASQLDTIMCPPPKSETANDIFTKENGNSCAVFDNSDTTETAISSVPDTCRDDPLSIGDFDGGPVPLSELNRLQYDIVSKISTIYSKDDLINYGNATSLDALAILGSSLETMIRLSLSVDIDPTTVLECTKNLSNTMDTMQRLCFYDYTAISYGMGNLLRHAKSVADALSLLILGKLPTIIRAVPTLKYDVPNLETTSMFLKLDLLRHVREVQAAYVSGDITLFRMIADAFSQRLALFSPTDSSWLSLPTQQFINDIIRIEGHLRQFCKFLILRPRDCHNNIMRYVIFYAILILRRLCYKHQALHKILTLFDDHGQLRHRPDQTTHFLDLRPQELLAFISSYKDHLNTIDSKTACLLLSMVADSYRGLSKQDEGMVRELLPLFFNKVYNNCSALTASDVLYVGS